MTVTCPTCGGDGEIAAEAAGWSTPPGSGEAAAHALLSYARRLKARGGKK